MLFHLLLFFVCHLNGSFLLKESAVWFTAFHSSFKFHQGQPNFPRTCKYIFIFGYERSLNYLEIFLSSLSALYSVDIGDEVKVWTAK